MSNNNTFNYMFIEQEVFNYLILKYLPKKFDQFLTNTEEKINLSSYLMERTTDKVGFISSYRKNNFFDPKFIKNNRISYISGICAILNKNFFVDVIYFFKENALDSIEFASLGETLPREVYDIKVLTTKEFDESMKSESIEWKKLKDKYS